MDEKLKTEDLITNNNYLVTEELLKNTEIAQNAYRNDLKDTKYLLGSVSNQFSQNYHKSNNNNTQQLINDKTSILYESKKMNINDEILPTDEILKNEEFDFLKSNKSSNNKYLK